MDHQIVRCDECGRATRMNVQTKRLPKKIEHVYFTCEHCSHTYTCYYTDEVARVLQKKIGKERHPIKKLNLQVKLRERMQKLKEEMNNSATTV